MFDVVIRHPQTPSFFNLFVNGVSRLVKMVRNTMVKTMVKRLPFYGRITKRNLELNFFLLQLSLTLYAWLIILPLEVQLPIAVTSNFNHKIVRISSLMILSVFYSLLQIYTRHLGSPSQDQLECLLWHCTAQQGSPSSTNSTFEPSLLGKKCTGGSIQSI